jgi:hypothetical protein
MRTTNSEASDCFDYSVAISDNRILVGAEQEGESATGGGNYNSIGASSAAYLFN